MQLWQDCYLVHTHEQIMTAQMSLFTEFIVHKVCASLLAVDASQQLLVIAAVLALQLHNDSTCSSSQCQFIPAQDDAISLQALNTCCTHLGDMASSQYVGSQL